MRLRVLCVGFTLCVLAVAASGVLQTATSETTAPSENEKTQLGSKKWNPNAFGPVFSLEGTLNVFPEDEHQQSKSRRSSGAGKKPIRRVGGFSAVGRPGKPDPTVSLTRNVLLPPRDIQRSRRNSADGKKPIRRVGGGSPIGRSRYPAPTVSLTSNVMEAMPQQKEKTERKFPGKNTALLEPTVSLTRNVREAMPQRKEKPKRKLPGGKTPLTEPTVLRTRNVREAMPQQKEKPKRKLPGKNTPLTDLTVSLTRNVREAMPQQKEKPKRKLPGGKTALTFPLVSRTRNVREAMPQQIEKTKLKLPGRNTPLKRTRRNTDVATRSARTEEDKSLSSSSRKEKLKGKAKNRDKPCPGCFTPLFDLREPTALDIPAEPKVKRETKENPRTNRKRQNRFWPGSHSLSSREKSPEILMPVSEMFRLEEPVVKEKISQEEDKSTSSSSRKEKPKRKSKNRDKKKPGSLTALSDLREPTALDIPAEPDELQREERKGSRRRNKERGHQKKRPRESSDTTEGSLDESHAEVSESGVRERQKVKRETKENPRTDRKGPDRFRPRSLSLVRPGSLSLVALKVAPQIELMPVSEMFRLEEPVVKEKISQEEDKSTSSSSRNEKPKRKSGNSDKKKPGSLTALSDVRETTALDIPAEPKVKRETKENPRTDRKRPDRFRPGSLSLVALKVAPQIELMPVSEMFRLEEPVVKEKISQ